MIITAADTFSAIDAYGADAVFHTDTPSYDPTTSVTTRANPATQTVRVVEEARTYRIPNDADCLIYLSPAGLNFTPARGQLVEYKGQHWTVISARVTAYQGNEVLWSVALKGV